MNILVISTVSYRSNGITQVIRNLYGNDWYKNDELSFLFPDDNDASLIAELEDKGFTVYQFPRYENGIWSYYKFLKQIVRNKNIEIVHIHGNSHALIIELFASMAEGCKIRICHSHNTTCNNILVHKLISPLFNMLCTHRIACGEAAGRWMYGNKEFIIIHNGINTEQFRFNIDSRNRIRNQYGIEENIIVIGHVGNLNKQKNQGFLIDIMNKVKCREHYRLMLVGEGEKRAELERKALELGIEDQVFFVGCTSDVPAYLSAMDVIAMPSLYEGLPLSLVEAQANGLNCVVSSAITEEAYISGNVFFIKNEGSIEDWVNAINHFSTDQDRVKSSDFAINAIRESGYEIDMEISRLYKLYVDLGKRNGKKNNTEYQ